MYFNSSRENTNVDEEFEKKKKFNFNYQKYKYFIYGFVGIVLLIVSILIISSFKKGKTKYFVNLLGNEEISIYQGDVYIDPGYTAYDNKGNDLTDKVVVNNMIDTSQEGEYQVIYILGDIKKERIVKVKKRPSGATVMYLKGSTTVYLKVGDTYEEPGYKVIDSVDGNLGDKVTVTGRVNTSEAGTYKITYTVTNNGGVTTSKQRVIVVMDSNISLTLNNEDYTNKNVNINIYVMDNYFDYLILPSGNKITSKVYSYSASENGEYKFVIYNKLGEKTEKTIRVRNIDKERPVASCSGTYGNGVSKINVKATDNVGISRYLINGNSYVDKSVTLDKEISIANVTVYDLAGNSSSISCSLKKIDASSGKPSTGGNNSYGEVPGKPSTGGNNSCGEVPVKVNTLSCWGGYVLEQNIDFTYYLMGVIWGEFGYDVNTLNTYEEFYKAFIIEVRTYSLFRGKYWDHPGYINMRNCSSDQNYCDIKKGCYRYNTQEMFNLCINNAVSRGTVLNGKFKPYYTANQCADRVTTNSGSGNSSGKPKFTVSNSKWPDYMSKVGTSNATVNKWKGSVSKKFYDKLYSLVTETQGMIIKDKNNQVVKIGYTACNKEKNDEHFCSSRDVMKLSKNKTALEILQGFSLKYEGVHISCYK